MTARLVFCKSAPLSPYNPPMDPIYLPLPEERRSMCLFLAAADQKAWMDLLLNPEREWVGEFANGLPAFLFALV